MGTNSDGSCPTEINRLEPRTVCVESAGQTLLRSLVVCLMHQGVLQAMCPDNKELMIKRKPEQGYNAQLL